MTENKNCKPTWLTAEAGIALAVLAAALVGAGIILTQWL